MIVRMTTMAGLVPLFITANLHAVDPAVPSQESVEHAVARVRPALVRIQVVTPDYSQGREVKYEASGSGVIISKDGYLITNHHVAGHATRAVCILSSNEEIEAELTGTDALSDICVLKLKGDAKREFEPVEFANSDAIRVGDTVLAMGSPLALSQSVTRGIVSNSRMVMPASVWEFGRFTLDGEDVGSIVRWIGHDAAIYPGNSGGPLVDLQGRVIGINEINLGLSGAIPGNLAQEIAQQLIRLGKVRRGWLGLELQPLLKDSNSTRGALVSGVAADSPAERAGFQSADILAKINDKEVSVRFWEELPLLNQLIAMLPMDRDAAITVLRLGKEVTLSCRPVEREPVMTRPRELKQWGMAVRNISVTAGRELKLANLEGVLVNSVRPGGPSGESKPTIQANDIIRKVGGKSVRNVQDLAATTKELTAGKTKPIPVVVEFDRKTEQFLTVVRVGIKEIEDPGLEVRKAWLPVGVQAITREMAEQLGLSDISGVRVTRIYSNAAAAMDGIKVGDFIVAVDDAEIPASKPGDEEVFETMMREYAVGATPKLTILRGKEKLNINVSLARTPKPEREMKKYRDETFEFTVRDLSFFDKAQEDWPADMPGVLVTEVREGGSAALGSLAGEDVVQAVNDAAITDVISLQRRMKELAKEKPKFVVLRVLRGIHTRYLELQANWSQVP